MHNYAKWILALSLAATTAYADEEKEENHPHETVKMSDLPQAVQKTVQLEAKGKSIESIKKETQNGKTIYEVELVSNGKGQEIEISAAGKVLSRHAMHEEKNEPEHGEQNK